jgi:hypothetical protein
MVFALDAGLGRTLVAVRKDRSREKEKCELFGTVIASFCTRK